MKRYSSLFTLLGLFALQPHDAVAQTRATIVPSVHMGSVYDDNVSATSAGDAGMMLQVRPSLEADYESPTWTLISLWSFDMQKSNHSALDDLDARRHAMFDIKNRSSAFTTWSLQGRYDHTDSPGELDLDSGLVTARRNADRYQVTPSVLHRFGQRTSLTALYDFTTESLEFGSDGTLHTARVNIARELSERTSFHVGTISRLFLDSAAAQHDSHAAIAGWTRQLRQFTTFTVQGGPRWTSYRGLVPEVSLSLARDGRSLKASAEYSHGETIILGVEGPVQVDTGSARVTWAATRKMDLGIHGGASSILTLDGRAADVYRGTLVGSWSVGGPYTVAASYSADYQLGDIRRNFFRDERVLRHVVRVGVTIAPSFKKSFLPPDEAARAKGVSR